MTGPTIAAVCAVIRERFSVAAVAAQAGVKLARAGREWKGRCPFHPDRTPSFTIYAADRRFQCFGCGAEGDVLDFIGCAYGVGLVEAVRLLDGGALAVLERAADRQSTDDLPINSDTSALAREYWRAAGPIAGTPAAAYLRRRGITLDPPPSLRFARLPTPKGSGLREASGPGPLPALVALVAGPDDRLSGVQRTYLMEDGAKAAAADGKVKFSLGRVKGGAIRLAPAGPELAVCEGLEDALSLMQLGAPAAWAAAGAGMLPAMRLPAAVRSVVIGADADPAERAAADEAVRTFGVVRTGLDAVRVIFPGANFRDFNAELVGDAR